VFAIVGVKPSYVGAGENTRGSTVESGCSSVSLTLVVEDALTGDDQLYQSMCGCLPGVWMWHCMSNLGQPGFDFVGSGCWMV